MKLTGKNGAMLDGKIAAGQEDQRHGQGRAAGRDASPPTRRRSRPGCTARPPRCAATRSTAAGSSCRTARQVGIVKRDGQAAAGTRASTRRPARSRSTAQQLTGPPRRPPDPRSAAIREPIMSVDPNAATQALGPSPEHATPPPDSPARYLVPALVAAAVAVAPRRVRQGPRPGGHGLQPRRLQQHERGEVLARRRPRSSSRSSRSSRRHGVRQACRARAGRRRCTAGRGRIAFLMAVPVAVHCLYALGYQTYSTRVTVALARWAASSSVRSVPRCCCSARSELPGWLLPIVGGWSSPHSRCSG